MAGYSLTNVPSGVYPLFGVMAFAVGGLGYFLYHKSTAPDVIWARKSNPHPWLSVKPNQTSKLYDPFNRFEKWSRFSA
ncbi:hypothetical protein BC832DRAFT_594124 [Gaertneriomyces semiglobifer]|nr:hypothetical protein BC832DRAFT_594124 [Gaertneriomyces semiglobifer]